MKDGFVAEILRAAGNLRSGDPAGATDIIRAALAAGGLATPKRASSDEVKSSQPGAERPWGTKAGLAAEDDQAQPHRDSADVRPEEEAEPRRRRPRKSLGDTVRILKARYAPRPAWNPPGRGKAAAIPVPEGATFRDLRYSCAEGARRYRLYVPASAGDGLRA